MCKPGEACNEAGKDSKTPNTQAFFGRLEMLIVMAELYETNAVDVPHAAVSMLDVIGPLMMDSMRKAKGWDGLQMAQAIIKQKRKLFEMQGITPPANAMEALVEMLGEIVGNGAKTAKDGA